MAVDALTKLTDPASSPDGPGNAAAWSGDYLAIAHDSGLGVSWYSRSGDSLTKMTDPATTGGSGKCCAWSGDYLVVGGTGTSGHSFYKREGSTLTSLTRGTAPGGTVFGLAWSGDYLAMAHSTGARLSLYKREGDTLTKLTIADTLPGIGNACAWNGDYLVVGHYSGNGLSWFLRTGDTLVKQTNPTYSPAANGALACAWVGDLLAVAAPFFPYFYLYQLSGGALNNLTSPTAPGSKALGFASDGNYLVVPVESTPWINLYVKSGATFNKLANPPAMVNWGTGAAWSATSNHVAVTHYGWPYFTWYLGPDVPVNILPPLLPLTVSTPPPVVYGAPPWPQKIGLALSLKSPAVLVVPSATAAGRTVYELTLTGAADGQSDLVLPLASFQGRLRSGDPSYLQVVVPGAAIYAAAIALRPNGEIVLRRGKEFAAGGRQLEEIARVTLGTISDDRGANSQTITLVGHKQTTNSAPKTRVLTGVAYRHGGSGARRFRAQFDSFLRPGDTASYNGESVVVGMIAYQVDRFTESMEITEA